jgi:hypothetical protein
VVAGGGDNQRDEDLFEAKQMLNSTVSWPPALEIP